MTIEELQAQIATMTAEMDKLKRANDSLSAENAQRKRDLEARMTEDEKRKAREQEREAYTKTLEAENEQLKRRDTLKKTWGKSISDNSVVEKIVELALNKDDDGMSNAIAEYYKAREEAIKAEKAKDDMSKDSNPPPASDNGQKAKTFMDYVNGGVKGMEELDKIRESNPSLYNQILATK